MFHTEDVGLVGASEVQVGLGAFMEALHSSRFYRDSSGPCS